MGMVMGALCEQQQQWQTCFVAGLGDDAHVGLGGMRHARGWLCGNAIHRALVASQQILQPLNLHHQTSTLLLSASAQVPRDSIPHDWHCTVLSRCQDV